MFQLFFNPNHYLDRSLFDTQHTVYHAPFVYPYEYSLQGGSEIDNQNVFISDCSLEHPSHRTNNDYWKYKNYHKCYDVTN